MILADLLEAKKRGNRGKGLEVHSPILSAEELMLREGKRFLELIKKHAPTAYKNFKHPIFRGMKYHGDLLFVDTNKSPPRKSVDGDNHYTLLIDNSPAYKDFPKRSRSLIVSGDSSTASKFADDTGKFPDGSTLDFADEKFQKHRELNEGGVYVVFPADSAKIAFLNTYDIFHATAQVFDGRIDFETLPEVLTDAGVPDDSFENLKSYFLKPRASRLIIEEFATYYNKSERWVERQLEKSPKQIFDEFLSAFNPEAQRVDLLSIRQLRNVSGADREGWVQGKAVLLSAPMWSILMHAIDKGKVSL